jgi:hypothetical protein
MSDTANNVEPTTSKGADTDAEEKKQDRLKRLQQLRLRQVG